MKKNCPSPTPSGNTNPTPAQPIEPKQAHGHTLGKKSQHKGKLTKSRGRKRPQTCTVQPGVRNTPNPQRGRPANAQLIVTPRIPKVIGVFAFVMAPPPLFTVHLTIQPSSGPPALYTRYEYDNISQDVIWPWGLSVGAWDSQFGTAFVWTYSEARGVAWLRYFADRLRNGVLAVPTRRIHGVGTVNGFEILSF